MTKAIFTIAAAIFFAISPISAFAKSPEAPTLDTFEDGALRLQVVALPSHDGDRLDITLIYSDSEAKTLRSVTVNPELVSSTDAVPFRAFMESMEPAFASFVRASLGDRLMHLRMQPVAFDRAESALFFPGVNLDKALARNQRAE